MRRFINTGRWARSGHVSRNAGWLRGVLVLLWCCGTLGHPAFADGTPVKEDARKAGRTVGSAIRDVGQGAKKAGKEIGQAAREGGREFRKAIRGH